jgi:hypothetical protein
MNEGHTNAPTSYFFCVFTAMPHRHSINIIPVFFILFLFGSGCKVIKVQPFNNSTIPMGQGKMAISSKFHVSKNMLYNIFDQWLFFKCTDI